MVLNFKKIGTLKNSNTILRKRSYIKQMQSAITSRVLFYVGFSNEHVQVLGKALGNKSREEKTLLRFFRKILFFTSLNCWNTFCGLKTSKIKFSGHTFFL